MLHPSRRILWLRQELLGPVLQFLSPFTYWLAYVWRRLLFHTTFIVVTGSLGKTTAKECLASILALWFPTYRTYRNQNGPLAVPWNVLRVRPWHRFAVLEVGVGKPGQMQPVARLLRPDMAVILNVLGTHTTAFVDLDQHAAEKAQLLSALKTHGVAVLNVDDARVATMADSNRFRVLTFGTHRNANVWADQVSARWPARLSFRVHTSNGTDTVATQFVGTHWLASALAALTVATSVGMKLRNAVAAFRSVEPFPGRLQPVRVPPGAVILRDDYNASPDTVQASLKVLQGASALRRVLVITDLSDFGANRKGRLRYLGTEAKRSADLAVFVGESAGYGKRRAIDAGMPPSNVYDFADIESASEFLKVELRQGDLVLLKGRTTDHAARIFFAQLGPVGCWKPYCPKRMLCDICWELETTPNQMLQAVVVKPGES